MSYSPPYAPTTSFAEDEGNQAAGRSTVRTARLDAELAGIKSTTDGLRSNERKVVRDDGKLKDFLVEPYALAEQTRAMMVALGRTPRGTWTPNTAYVVGDLVQYNTTSYMCVTAHMAGASFVYGQWMPISADGAAVESAEAAAAAAVRALASETQAGASSSMAQAAAVDASADAAAASAAALDAVNAANAVASHSYAAWRTITDIGTGAPKTITLDVEPGSVHNMRVSFEGGFVADPTEGDYSLDGNQFTFTAPFGKKVLIQYGQSLPQGAADGATTTFVQAGTGAVSRSMQTRDREIVYVTDFSGVDPTGVADSTAGVTNAVAQAWVMGALLLWNGIFKVTASIPKLHDVQHIGPGRITRGAATFWLCPREAPGHTNTLYVDPAGNDSNDGLAATSPLATLSRAAAVLLWNGDRGLPGKWVLQLAPGTYGSVAFSSGLRMDYPLEIKGPTAGHPNVPTAIIDGTGNASGTGISVSYDNWIRVTDVLIQNFTTGTGCMVIGGRLGLTNVHQFNNLIGCTYQHLGYLSAVGGIWDGNNIANSVGLQALFNATHGIVASSVAAALLVKRFDRGMLIDEGAQGHLDFLRLEDNNTGLNLKRGAGACNTKQMQVYRNAVGFLIENNGWFNNGVDFGAGANANTVNVRTLGGSPELIFQTSTNAARTMRLVEAKNVAQHTGTTSETLLYTSPTIPDWVVSEAGHMARVYIALTASITFAGAIRFYLNNGSDDLIGGLTLPVGLTDGVVECTVWYSASNGQRAGTRLSGNGNVASAKFDTGSLALKNTAHSIRAKVQLGASGDQVTLQIVALEATFGG